MLRLIAFYQRWLSPLMAPRCRFYPSCSSYAAEAIGEYGNIKGGFMAVKRLSKCHPFHEGGYDPVQRQCDCHPSAERPELSGQ
jgi:putative membrane protein insertion efficiency factor